MLRRQPSSPRSTRCPNSLPTSPPSHRRFKFPLCRWAFSSQGAINLGLRNSVVSLDFLDENRLLFTFRVPGLVHRDSGEYEERQIRAVVLKLPTGTVEAEALWDGSRPGALSVDTPTAGSFLLRDRNNLEMGDATLELKPFCAFRDRCCGWRWTPRNSFW